VNKYLPERTSDRLWLLLTVVIALSCLAQRNWSAASGFASTAVYQWLWSLDEDLLRDLRAAVKEAGR
jgi:hypothetical protein